MIPIHICEDDQAILHFLKEKISTICMIENYDFAIQLTTTSPFELLEQLSAQPMQGIYFLDVDLKQKLLDGFELGKQIRALDPRGFIIYITTYTELLGETFKYRVEALDYISKDDESRLVERIAASLSEINQRCQTDTRKEKEFFSVQKVGGTSYVPLDEILYFETSDKKHVLNLVTEHAYIEFYGNLSEIQQTLGANFFRTHRSYLVNSKYIAGVEGKENLVRLTNGDAVFLARGKKAELLKTLKRSDAV